MTTSQGSPFWQGVILFTGLAFLLWEAWRGWRSGVVRSGMNFAALVVSSLIGYMAAQAAAAPAGGFKDLHGLITGAIVGLGVGLVVFFIIWLVSAILFGGIGAMVGAVLGESWKGRDFDTSIQIGKAAFVGRLLGTVGKQIVCTLMVIVALGAMLL